MGFLLFLAALFGGTLAFGVWLVRWQFRRADELLEAWAARNGYRITHKQPANIGDGPMGTRQASKQVRFRITAIDVQGTARRGLAVIGNRATGTMADEVIVEWEG